MLAQPSSKSFQRSYVVELHITYKSQEVMVSQASLSTDSSELVSMFLLIRSLSNLDSIKINSAAVELPTTDFVSVSQ